MWRHVNISASDAQLREPVAFDGTGVSMASARGAVTEKYPVMKSAIVKRSISVCGHKTSVSLEAPFWEGLKEIAERRRMTVSQVIAEINAHRQQGNLSSTIRLFVLDQVRVGGGMPAMHQGG